MIVWHELFTTDVEAAKAFYTELLGAEIESAPMGDTSYDMLKKGERSHAGIVQNPSEGAIPSHWYPYVHTGDVGAATDQAVAAGAQLIHGPQEIPDMLTFSVLGGTQHETFGLLSGGQGADAPQGVFAWDELHAADADGAIEFYSGLAGWTAAPMMDGYWIFNEGETGVAGLSNQGADHGGFWLPYLAADVDASHAKAKELGAEEMMAPESMPEVGRFSILRDPTGAAFGLFEPPADRA